jgi:squalene-hopene/tetraprenyl-beta-curcumene cyclase
MTTLLAFLLAAQDAADPARRAVERSLPFLEMKGTDWIRDRKCASCHHVPFMVWVHREARDRGLPVDSAKLDAWTGWALDFARTSTSREGEKNGGGLDTLAQLILARPAKADFAPYGELAGLIRGFQKADGSWAAGGQLPSQRRDKAETDDASTRWVVLALRTLPGREDSLTKAEAWIGGRPSGKSTESLALHVLTASSPDARRELLARRNGDGGWGWMKGEPSDALATGITLYALGGADPGARDFLVRTQLEDGSWKVPSTKAKSRDDAISSYWGTAWAALGLLQDLPQAESPSSSLRR